MNWDAIGAIGELVGAVTVVVTLLYLAIQVRRGTSTTQAASIQAAAAMDHEFLLTLGSDPVTAQLWMSYLAAPETLPDDQKMQGHILMTSLIRRLENLKIQNQLGTLPQEGWQSRQALFNVIARSRGYSAFLDSPMAAVLSDDFAEYMTQLNARE
jgi:hypothetical protein